MPKPYKVKGKYKKDCLGPPIEPCGGYNKEQTNQREIKFRVWNVPEERMFVVDTLYFDKGLVGLYAEYKDETKIDGKFGLAAPGNYVLMQYTGLKDKNGKEIYEGDIVKEKFGETKVVEWANYGKWLPFGDDDYCWHAKDVEVIGNICKNPDYLKKPNEVL